MGRPGGPVGPSRPNLTKRGQSPADLPFEGKNHRSSAGRSPPGRPAHAMLFSERGFENVTVDEVAAAASVSKMTVFNYFPRKEDLFFDRGDETQQFLRGALEGRGRLSPLAAQHALVHELFERRHPLVKITASAAAGGSPYV